MGLIDAVRVCLAKYVTFSGRARRSEYWYWTLFLVLVQIGLAILEALVAGSDPSAPTPAYFAIMAISGVFALGIILPSIAVAARRLHDIGRSGWWQVIYIVPLIGLIVMIVWCVRRGDAGANRFGADPLATTSA